MKLENYLIEEIDKGTIKNIKKVTAIAKSIISDMKILSKKDDVQDSNLNKILDFHINQLKSIKE